MYANLDVRLPDGRHVFAWDIDITSTEIILKLDANNGEGNYAEPDGELRIAREAGIVNVGADF